MDICDEYFSPMGQYSRDDILLGNLKEDVLLWISVIFKQRILFHKTNDSVPSCHDLYLSMLNNRRFLECRSKLGGSIYFVNMWGLFNHESVQKEIEQDALLADL